MKLILILFMTLFDSVMLKLEDYVFIEHLTQCVTKMERRKSSKEPRFIVLKRLRSERIATFRQIQHPKIVQLFKLSQKGQICDNQVAMKLYAGNLNTLVGDHGLDPSWTLDILLQCLDGLIHLQAQGSCHGNLKPENILFNYDQEKRPFIKLSDVGLGLQPSPYTSPDVQRTSKTDVYSLSLILGYLLTGESPDSPSFMMKIDRFAQFRRLVRLGSESDPTKRLTLLQFHDEV